jgi:hypothetical protein
MAETRQMGGHEQACAVRSEVHHPAGDAAAVADNAPPAACVIGGKEVLVTGRFLKTASLRSEAHVALEDAESFVENVRQSRIRADLFTFAQGVNDRTRRYAFYAETDKIAVLPLTTYDHWFNKQLYFKPRNKLRKALKSGIEVRLEEFNDALLHGIKAIYDETPVRQGKRNYHYNKDFETIKREHSMFLDRSQFIAVHYAGEMIGFAKVTFSQGCGIFMNFLSKVSHRDKATNNALLAKAVEICAERKVSALVYGVWGSGGTAGLVEFKVANGFECVEVPRYFVPLTTFGRLALKAGVHRGIVRRMPRTWVEMAAKVRERWNAFRFKAARGEAKTSEAVAQQKQ